MKLAVIGNSHAACFKTAWDELLLSHLGIEPIFFASPGERLRTLQIEGDSITTSNEQAAQDIRFTSGGLSSIRVEEYDCFLMIGLGYRTPILDRRLSRAVSALAVEDCVTNSLCFHVLSLVRELAGTKIAVACQPYPTSQTIAPPLLPAEEVTQIANRKFKDRNVTFYHCPSECLMENCYSIKKDFLVGAPRLAHNQRKLSRTFDGVRNFVHMNTQYGKLFWEKILTEIDL